VHANDLETLPAAYLLARELHSRLVYDAHELYAEFDPDPPRLARAALMRLERELARRADAVVTVSTPIADELRRRLGVEPIVVLNTPELDPREPPEPVSGALRAVYQGAFGTGRPIDELLEAVRGAPSVQLTLRVNRASREALEAGLPEDIRGRVRVEEPVAPSDVVTALHGHHVGLLFDRPLTMNAELSAPNKLFEYLMAGLAVVAPDLRGLRWLAEEELGVLFEAGSPESFGRALESLAADPDRVARLRANARRAALERYNAEAQRGALAQAWGEPAPPNV
jgi:glycosyltransferase involved in cell wall biosynthesis